VPSPSPVTTQGGSASAGPRQPPEHFTDTHRAPGAARLLGPSSTPAAAVPDDDQPHAHPRSVRATPGAPPPRLTPASAPQAAPGPPSHPLGPPSRLPFAPSPAPLAPPLTCPRHCQVPPTPPYRRHQAPASPTPLGPSPSLRPPPRSLQVRPSRTTTAHHHRAPLPQPAHWASALRARATSHDTSGPCVCLPHHLPPPTRLLVRSPLPSPPWHRHQACPQSPSTQRRPPPASVWPPRGTTRLRASSSRMVRR
jgi:hypothetical protein